MIKPVKVTPLYDDLSAPVCKNLGIKPVVRVGICIVCDFDDADEFFNLAKKGAKRMIKSMKITPLYERWKNLGFMQITGFGIYIECGPQDADEILNLVKKMADRRYSIESGEEKDDD